LRIASLAVDKRAELLYSILLNTSWRDVGIMEKDYPYKLRLVKFSEAFKEHKAVVLCEELIRRGFVFDALHAFAVHLSDPPSLALAKPLTEDLVERAGTPDILMEFAARIKSYYDDSSFEEFWRKNIEFYRRVEKNAERYINLNKIVNIIEDYFGLKKGKYSVVLLTLSRYSYGYSISDEVYAFVQPTTINEEGLPEYRSWDSIIHELSHSFVNPLTEEFESDFMNADKLFECAQSIMKRLFSGLLGSLSKSIKEEAYGDWKTFVNEHIVVATVLRIAEKLGYLNSDRLERFLQFYERRGLVYIRSVYKTLLNYDRAKYSSFKEFYPEIIKLFNGI